MRDAAPDPRTIALTQDDLLWAAGSLCNLHRLPFSAALLQRECPPPCSATQLIGTRRPRPAPGVGRPRSGACRLLPAIVFLRPFADAACGRRAARGGTPRLALLVGSKARVLLFHAGSNEPTVRRRT
jgi:hypothetical protein